MRTYKKGDSEISLLSDKSHTRLRRSELLGQAILRLVLVGVLRLRLVLGTRAGSERRVGQLFFVFLRSCEKR